MNPPKPHTTKIPALQEFLKKKGFKFSIDPMKEKTNSCKWNAYKTTEIESRECECNTGKGMQLVINPYQYNTTDSVHESVEVSITGEYKATWFHIKAYSMSPGELVKEFKSIEASLVRAWNALEK